MRNNTEPPRATLAKKKAKTTEQAPSADEVGPISTPTYERADASATGKVSSKATKAKLNKLQSEQQSFEEQLDNVAGTDRGYNPQIDGTETPIPLHTL